MRVENGRGARLQARASDHLVQQHEDCFQISPMLPKEEPQIPTKFAQNVLNSSNFQQSRAEAQTGRTHQIRVHFAAIEHPLLADPIYGNNSKLIKRHALHAYTLEFSFEGKDYSFISPIPEDIQNLLKTLEKQSKHMLIEKTL